MSIKLKRNPTVRVVCRHLSLLGLGGTTGSLIHDVDKWILHSGPEWTVRRLKSLKLAFLRLLAGEKPAYEWIKHRGDLPSGPWRALFRLGLSSPKGAQRALSALMVYTGFRSPKLTLEQKAKYRNAIAGPSPVSWQLGTLTYVERLAENNGKIASKVYGRLRRPSDLTEDDWSFAGLGSGKPNGLLQGRNSAEKWLNSLILGLNQENAPYRVLEAMGAPVLAEGIYPEPGSNLVGHILVLQEPGFKARVVASPLATWQVAFKPLHDQVMRILRRIPADCTHDQAKGVQGVLRHLRRGGKAWSIDLSSATDNFPRRFTQAVLRGFGGAGWDDLLEVVSTGRWYDTAVGDYISYSKGQPMGLFGSFPMFALSHHVLVWISSPRQWLWELWNGKREPWYYVLGDDLVILDERVADTHRRVLEKLEIPVSWDKSFLGTAFAEFAGKAITPSGVVATAKVPRAGMVNSWYNYLKVIGPKGLRFLPSKIRRIARIVAGIPDFLGGLGFNPRGIPLEERIAQSLNLLDKESWVPPP
jgi:hypothetical protein